MAVIGNRFTPAFAGTRSSEPTPSPPGPDIRVEPLATLINGRRVRGQLTINGTTDLDPSVASVHVDWGDGTPYERTVAPYLIVHEYALEAVYEIRVIAVSAARRESVAGTRVEARGDPTALPFASFVYDPMPFVPVGTLVQFDAAASQPGTGGPLTQYDWDWGDGGAIATDAGPNPTHTFIAVGQPRVALRVVDAIGEWDVTTRAVIVEAAEEPEEPER